ncbi:unnamed protein product [Phytophthora lilii]|uniref:Unnamed protein product n=1 Tax=Phytophthora lilii TaxID=2077276 RepID=A0A9W6U7Q6_9STRA|nr:unnamed protein product [Phytophthora lilii]
MKEDGVTRAVAFSQYPQWSCTTSGSSMNHLWRELDRLDMKEDFKWSLIDRWNTHPGYISAVANRVKIGLEQYAPEDRDKVIIMFSAHSVPMKTVYKGDSYVNEIAATAERVMKQLAGKNPHILSWQSKVGYLPWMGPSTSDVIKRYGEQGHKYVRIVLFMGNICCDILTPRVDSFDFCRHVMAVPIAFTSDHIETLYEIDIEYGEEAKAAGITERQGQYAAPRHEYLQQLVDEFQRSPDVLRKEEIVANLANFAYDPINYSSLCRLRIMDLFLDILDADQDENNAGNEAESKQTRQGTATTTYSSKPARKRQLVEFALGGICNCIPDPLLQQQFIDGDGVDIVAPYILQSALQSEQTPSPPASELNVVVSALTIAYFLLDSSAFAEITSERFMTKMQSLQHHSIVQIANTAAAFLARFQELLASAS